jgi:uncharacterized protein (TIGR02246 family)
VNASTAARLLVLSLAAAPACAQPAASPEARAAVSGWLEKWNAATEAQDLPALLSMVTDDVIVLPPGRPPVRGKSELGALYTQAFSRFRMEQDSTFAEIVLAGDWAFAWGADAVVLTPAAGGEPIRVSGSAVSILKREADGAWRLARGINNMLPQRPRPGAAKP